MLPFGPDLWLRSDDIPGPEYASAGTWKDRTDNHNDAVQADASKWPSKTLLAPDMPVATEFKEEQSLTLKKPLSAPAWTLWAVFYGHRGMQAIVAGPEPDLIPGLAGGSNIPLHRRFISFAVGSIFVSPTVSASGAAFVKPVFAKVTYDGTDLTLTCYNDLTGSQTRSHPNTIYTLSFVGYPGNPSPLPTFIGEVIYWKRVLSDEENGAILAYLTGRYQSPEEEDMKPGTVIDFAGPVVPSGYLACDGADYAELDYADLATAIDHTWDTFRGQSAPASGRFRVPLLAGLVIVGAGASSSNPATSARTFGDALGEEAHQLVTGELAAHGHTVNDPGHLHYPGSGGNFATDGTVSANSLNLGFATAGGLDGMTTLEGTGVSVNTEGSDTAHNNMQPSAVMRKCIKT